jgi:hypothetical protein
MKSSNFPLIIFTLIALLYAGFEKIDCERNRQLRPYLNAYPLSLPVNDRNNSVPIRVTTDGRKKSSQRKISGSALVSNKFSARTNSTQERMQLINV